MVFLKVTIYNKIFRFEDEDNYEARDLTKRLSSILKKLDTRESLIVIFFHQ